MNKDLLFEKRVKRMLDTATDLSAFGYGHDAYNTYTIDGKRYEVHYYNGYICEVLQVLGRKKHKRLTITQIPYEIMKLALHCHLQIALFEGV